VQTRRQKSNNSTLRERAQSDPHNPKGRNIFVRNIPNMLTSITVFCGFVLLLLPDKQIGGGIHTGAIVVCIGLVTDILDGLAARALSVKSPVGANFDQLADLTCFGLAPAVFFVRMRLTVDKGQFSGLGEYLIKDSVSYICGFCFFLSSVFRIARELSVHQGARPTYFVGIPTNLSAFLLVPFVSFYPMFSFLPIYVLVLAYLMVSKKKIPKGLWIIDVK